MATDGINNELLHQHIRIRMSHNIISTVNAVQGDTAREFYFVFDDYDIPEDAEIRVYVRKPSGREIYHYCYLANGEVVVQPTMQMLAEIGKNIGQIQIIKNHAIVTSYIFNLLVEPNIIYSISITSMDEFLILSDLIDNARIAIDDIKMLSQKVEEQEAARVNAESARVQAENKRQTDTSNAIANCNAATDRANSTSETLKTQEEARVDAESARVQAENKRQTDTYNAIANCNNAADRANTAAETVENAISGVINDTLTSAMTTYSSEKIENKFTNIEASISKIINDEASSTTSTYSSNNIDTKLDTLEDLMSTIIQINTTEPANQLLNGIWLIED